MTACERVWVAAAVMLIAFGLLLMISSPAEAPSQREQEEGNDSGTMCC